MVGDQYKWLGSSTSNSGGGNRGSLLEIMAEMV